jgi:hypothetical protein
VLAELFSSGAVVDTYIAEAAMGLMDVLNGMRNGPRGQLSSTPSSGGMSHLTMGLLALLAYKAYKGSASAASRVQDRGLAVLLRLVW